MTTPDFTMSMFASEADLYKAKAEYFELELRALREHVTSERDFAANPGPYLDDVDYDRALGKELALDEVLDKLDKALGDK